MSDTRELTVDQFDSLVATMYDDITQPTVGTIASQLGVGYSVVYRALKRKGVRRRPQGPVRIGFLAGSKSDQVAQLLVTNHPLHRNNPMRLSHTDIAHKVGCTRELVRNVCAKLKARGKLKQ
jgi:CRP-like cAMP-binding protein